MWDAAVETFGQWLREQVWSRQWGATDLAREISALDPNEKPLSKSAVSEWMNGNRIPRPVQCIKIAKALGIEPRIVLEKAGRVDEAPAEREPLHFPIPAVDPFLVNLRLIPLMDVTVHAGQVHYLATETIPVDSRITGDLVGVRVEGDCLTPQIEPGDVVVVDKAGEWQREGAVIVVLTEGSVLLRRVQRDNLGELVLMSNKDIGRPAGAIVLGRVVQIIRSLK
jgi:transcriptional regulator with XRE-family HTH domain